MQRISEAGGWLFVGHPWTGGEHLNVWIAEDFRFRWSLAEAAARDAAKTAELLSVGTRPLLAPRSMLQLSAPAARATASAHAEAVPELCPKRTTPASWRSSCRRSRGSRPSSTAKSSRHHSSRPPSGGRSGRRRVPAYSKARCGTCRFTTRRSDWPPDCVNSLESPASTTQTEVGSRSCWRRCAEGLELGDLPVLPGSSSAARQAFIGLHRLAYERLSELALDDDRRCGGPARGSACFATWAIASLTRARPRPDMTTVD